ncbi:hypothetical protein H257_10483 [Aphanomyces astaci]|uniref:Uncharacterized protein n=1 Tax=Aphanomyces astaci TaxID=112090 RepID=W4G6J6_APHAT|nr:hypothetical protein H257_10483 [Aphanomyces astaci]ETV75300.1 hypothetical protein H257_10483 [Aphanomyces astaci]|eukprot:XP_009835348.1 hypothetical protein H257_10483 [Aphanomyces astaci]
MLRLPAPVGAAVVVGMGIAWYAAYTLPVQFSCVFAASAFACIEFTWYANTTELENGDLRFTPFQPTCRAGHTTWAQFWANVVYTPVLLYAYRAVVPSAVLRVLLFPCNIWLLEILEGYTLMLLFGRNIAWTYTTSDAYCHGNIRLGFWKLWLVLGLVLECGGYRALDALGQVCASTLPLEGVVLGFGVATVMCK